MYFNELAIPRAYFITFTCYGTWLPGEKSTYVERDKNIFGTEFLSLNSARHTSAKKRMMESPYLLDEVRRLIVLDAIKEVCQYRAWILLAAHVRTNHVHIVVHASVEPELIMNSIKAYASRKLNAAQIDGNRIKRWTRHGSTKYIWVEEAVEVTIQYVVYEQGHPMAVFNNRERSFN